MICDLTPEARAAIVSRLGPRSVTLIGLMGAGKTTVGRRLAQILGLPFKDSDVEIETISRMSVPELFAAYGEPEFRALEARVVRRLSQDGPQVIATGGGAFMDEGTRAVLKENTITVWLKADLDTLMDRVGRRGNRPLLRSADPRGVMADLMARRYPVYALADVTIVSRNVKRETIALEIAETLALQLAKETA
ncbi:shikimate kinase [Aurantimonas sp. Leaf443]|uniref:shikimate kinase n=1 Tax=Aurantimonas sp. Leaf443 TaxID=1736378 RepID=UPI0006F39E49|nr:shikimate kinase [Aurantimonas sp. Leaf443]KQT85867.1 shikimate kinase [Aurantimonas sp. Leaf443]